ncbi:uncharacterized protein K452DRAFT_258006 [Aplosporella prunicola CBS 121167]|uniref:rRNA methyltransferase 1, mitochondrial n=1 Tax=Aplosporella prunicola CBS 121167 TaxID=1176127 RepID=A0A6A6AZ94_9PEZI|nr:uncharacterized protein K452DRAFT_258006 [Aplosporella prunicola CBS 121167]KAF2137239.1 hypothetical protein K452DRAFT_258006 [Aplosporella prunicola CBS 121167]
MTEKGHEESDTQYGDEGPEISRIPYTTAASQFIYGMSSVRAALKAGRRRFYKLYIHDRALNRSIQETNDKTHNTTSTLLALARDKHLSPIYVDNSWLKTLDMMSEGRPHNGCVLEASPLPVYPSEFLRGVSRSFPYFQVDFTKQSAEDKMINGNDPRIKYNSHGWRFPLVLYLDGIKDEGNLGAIFRSAYYLGVDAIAVSKRATAPLSAIATKASSGAVEAIPVITVNNPINFISHSILQGWRVYAADVPPPPKDNFNVTSEHHWRALDPDNTSPLITCVRPNSGAVLGGHSPLAIQPTILMFGSEGSGFAPTLRARANYIVGIRGVRGDDILGVDSLNVSVAAALISMEFLKKPNKALATKGIRASRTPPQPPHMGGKDNLLF